MSSLPTSIKEEFKSKWVVSKTCNRFSSIPIDQIHEQEDAKVKGKGGEGSFGLKRKSNSLETLDDMWP